MNPRERVLASCVVGLLVVGGLWVVVKWGVIDRWQNLREEVMEAADREERLEDRLEVARLAEKCWTSIRPLSHNPELGAQRFREDVSELLDQHGLGGADCTVQDSPPRKLKSSGDEEFTEVRVRVTAKGQLKQVMDFLCDFYRRGYPARVDRMSLTAESKRRSRVARRGRRTSRGEEKAASVVKSSDRDGPKLNLTMTVTALVLQQIEGGPDQPAIEAVRPEDGSNGRLPRERPEYDVVLTKNLFREGAAPRKTVTTVAVKDPDGDKPPPPPPPPAKRPKKILIATTSTGGKLEACVRDEDHRELPPEWLKINDPVDDGTLVLVYQQGMVVQVAEETEDAFEFKYYVYKLGDSFSERELLDAARYPELQRQLDRCLVQK